MNSANHAAMLRALRGRRGHGMDLTIIMGHPNETHGLVEGDSHNETEEEKDQKELGLAPEGTPLSDDGDVKHAELGNLVHGDSALEDNPEDDAENPKTHPDEEEDKKLIHHELSKSHLLGRGTLHHGLMHKKNSDKRY